MSEACRFCYAEAFAKRTGHQIWGKDAPRRFFGDKHWREPLKWNAQAERDGVRQRVFCASMADVFEDRRDLDEVRDRLWDLIHQTPHLDWLLLTKRPEKMTDFVPEEWRELWPANVWAGTTAENQEWWDKRIPHLLAVPAQIRFVSMEPLLGPVRILGDLMQGKDPGRCGSCGKGHGFTRCPNYGGVNKTDSEYGCTEFRRQDFALHQIIVGGESGPKARPFDIAWARSILKQCSDAAVPAFTKQCGAHIIDRNDAGWDGTEPTSWPEDTETDDWHLDPSRQYQGAPCRVLLRDRKGGDPEEWPADLRIRQFPESAVRSAV